MSGLDDFFKKRDKKKKTTTKAQKFSTLDTEELAKNLEVASIQAEEIDTNFQDKNERVPTSENLDEEWKPFDSEDNKDYTGLRINTQTWNDEDEENEEQGVVDNQSNKPACPWASGKGRSKKQENDDEEDDNDNKNTEEPVSTEPKTIAAVLAEKTTNSTAESNETKAEPTKYIPPSMRARMNADASATSKPAAPSTGAYVPPSMRNKAADSSSSDIPPTSVNYRRPNKSQPNFNDCLEFPSLDAMGPGGPEKNNTQYEKFEFAKKSGRVEPKNEKSSQIDLQNKFATLTNQ